MCSGRVSSSCSTSGTCRVNLHVVTNPLIGCERRKAREICTTSGTYPWSFVTQIFRSSRLMNFDCWSSRTALHKVYVIWTFCCSRKKALVKVYQWFYIGSQIVSFERSLSLFPGPQNSLVPLYKTSLEGPEEWNRKYVLGELKQRTGK